MELITAEMINGIPWFKPEYQTEPVKSLVHTEQSITETNGSINDNPSREAMSL